MKKVVIIIFLIGMYHNNGFAQKSISDDLKFKATYRQTAHVDSTDTDFVITENMHLLIGYKISTFSSAGMNVEKRLKVYGNLGYTNKNSVTEFLYLITKSKMHNLTYYSETMGSTKIMHSDSLSDLQWELTSEIKEYKKYKCQRATTTWRGRFYTAWFTEDIPISDGPYKFSGLPGLIVELYDIDKHYHFELLGFEKLNKALPFKMKFKDYVEMNRKDFFKEHNIFMSNPPFYEPNPNVTASLQTKLAYKKTFSAKLAKRNNVIELE